MGNLFFMDNTLKEMRQRIGKVDNRGNVKDSSVKVLFEKMDRPEKLTKLVYGYDQSDLTSAHYDPWTHPFILRKRAHFKAYVQIGDISATMSFQELANLTERLRIICDAQDQIANNTEMNEVF